MKRTNYLLLLFVLLLAVVMICTACSAEESAPEDEPASDTDQTEETASYIDTDTNYQLSWGTASTTGSVYPMGAALAAMVSKYYPNINISVEATGGSVENARLIYSGDVEIGVLQGTTAYQAYTGTTNYDCYQDVLALMQSNSTVVQILVREDSGIETFADLAGKKVGVGPAGSGTEQSVSEIFPLLGLTYDDFDEQFLSFTEAAQAMQDGDIVAAVFGSTPPTPAVMDLRTNTKVRPLSFTEEDVEKIIATYPYFYPYTIEPGTYDGQEEAITTVCDRTIFAVNKDMPDSLAYMLLDAWINNPDEANEVQGVVDFSDVNARAQVGIPMHPGAKAWFDEHGITYPTEFDFDIY